ncbi:MAG: hypothetical protein ACYSUB_19070 [Planctomycetota bacterium]
MATEAQILFNRRNAQQSDRPPNKPPIQPSLPKNYYLIMQNEPNFGKAQMNVNKVLTRDYENKPNWTLGENEPKTNPIKAKQSQFSNATTVFRVVRLPAQFLLDYAASAV